MAGSEVRTAKERDWCRILANATMAVALATIALAGAYFIVDFRGMLGLPQRISDLPGMVLMLPFCCLMFMAIYVRYQFVSIAIMYCVTIVLLVIGCALLIRTRTSWKAHKRLWWGLIVLPLVIPLFLSLVTRWTVPAMLRSECAVAWLNNIAVERAQDIPGWQETWSDAIVTIDESDVERFFSLTNSPIGAGWQSKGKHFSGIGPEGMSSDVLQEVIGFRPKDACRYVAVSWDTESGRTCYGLVEFGRSSRARVYLVMSSRP